MNTAHTCTDMEAAYLRVRALRFSTPARVKGPHGAARPQIFGMGTAGFDRPGGRRWRLPAIERPEGEPPVIVGAALLAGCLALIPFALLILESIR